jgi:hypothetical protein
MGKRLRGCMSLETNGQLGGVPREPAPLRGLSKLHSGSSRSKYHIQRTSVPVNLVGFTHHKESGPAYMVRETFPPVLLFPWEFEGGFDGDQELALRVG